MVASGADWYDRARRNSLIDKYYANSLSPGEATELHSYIERDVSTLQEQGNTSEELLKLLLFLAAIGGLLYLLGKK